MWRIRSNIAYVVKSTGKKTKHIQVCNVITFLTTRSCHLTSQVWKMAYQVQRS